jgi:hypothetical protein
MRAEIGLIVGFALLAGMGWYFYQPDPFCEPIRIARVIELGGCR